MSNVELTTVEVYDTTFQIPAAYKRGYGHVNCYPQVIPGRWCYGGLVEQRMQYLLLRYYLPPGSIFIDVGAACGVYSYLASRRCSQVLAFEPIEGLAALAQQNTPDHVFVHACALTNNPSHRLYIGAFGTHEIRIAEERAVHRVPIQTARLDDYYLAPYTIKIDVEGMGAQVLRGGFVTLEQAHVVFLEVHAVEEYEECEKLFKQHGFRIQPISESHVIAVREGLKLPQDYECY